MARAIIISPTYNARRYTKASVLSVADQLPYYPDIIHIIVDDCSTDGTWERLHEDDISGEHQVLLRNETNGASAVGSFMRGVKYAEENLGVQPEDVYFWLDGDDWLCDKRAIRKMMRAYARNPEVEMCYSNHYDWRGGDQLGDGFSHPLGDRTLVRYANVAYSHLRSFKPHMLDYVEPWRLKDDDGNYWKFAGDSALFLPMLEVAKRVKHIEEPFVIYNCEREDNEAKKAPWEQRLCSHAIREQTPNTNARPEVFPTTEFAPTRRFKLDFGRVCNLSCSFCYYLHQKPWRNLPTEEIEKQIAAGAARGDRMCDISGGEPTISKELPIWLNLCNKYGITPGIITHGQDVEEKLEDLWDHGLSDILFSVHGQKEYHEKVTGTQSRNGSDRLYSAMRKCSEAGFAFRTNTVLTENYKELPAMARELTKVKPLISNFINFNPYYEWGCKEKPEFQAKVSDIAPYLEEAIDILVANGTSVNVRYFPICVMRGYERHNVGMAQVMTDPYEWDYNVMPKTTERYHAYGQELADRACAFGDACAKCGAAGTACLGVNKVYLETYGDGELKPYEEEISDRFHWRRHASKTQLENYVGPNYRWLIERARGKTD